MAPRAAADPSGATFAAPEHTTVVRLAAAVREMVAARYERPSLGLRTVPREIARPSEATHPPNTAPPPKRRATLVIMLSNHARS